VGGVRGGIKGRKRGSLSFVPGLGREFGGEVEVVVGEHVEADASRLCVLQEDGQRGLALAHLITGYVALIKQVFKSEVPDKLVLRET
jgi:hypothetical protein